jgi:hypothetical protein
MLKHGFPKPNFKEFMAGSAQVNWNAVKIVYGSRDPYVRVVDKEHTYGPCEYFFCELLMTSFIFCAFKTGRCPFSLNFHLLSISFSLVTFQIFLMILFL